MVCVALNDNGHPDDGGYSPFTINGCPKCGSQSIAAQVTTWVYFNAGRPDSFDNEDLEQVEIVDGGCAICRDCQHSWVIHSMAGR